MEENKEIKNIEINNKSKKKIPMYVYIIGISAVLLIILIVALAVMANSEDEVVTDSPKVEETETVDPSKLNDAAVKKIYEDTLPYIDNYVGASVYHVNKMTVLNTNTNFLRSFAFTKIQFKEGEKLSYLNEGELPVCGDGGCNDGTIAQGWYRFDPVLLQNQAKYYYGTEIANGDFSDKIYSNVMYENGMYKRSDVKGNGILSYNYREFVSYEVIEDTLYITDKYLYLYGVLDDRGEHYEIGIYGDSSKHQKFGSGKYLEADNLVEFIVPNYDRKKVTYKHAFKQADDGHWYWISSEQVK